MADWMRICVELPEDEGLALIMFLKEKAGFHDIDWCVMQRPDFARVSYGPIEPRTESGYG